jgi:protease I
MNKAKKVCKILMIVGDYAEDNDVMLASQAIPLFDHEIHTVYPLKKEGDKVKTLVHYVEEGDETYITKTSQKFELNYDFGDVKLEEYDGLIIPGGRVENLKSDTKVIEITSYFLTNKKPIAAVGNGVQCLFLFPDQVKGLNLLVNKESLHGLMDAGAYPVASASGEAWVEKNIVTAKECHTKLIKKFIGILNK